MRWIVKASLPEVNQFTGNCFRMLCIVLKITCLKLRYRDWETPSLFYYGSRVYLKWPKRELFLAGLFFIYGKSRAGAIGPSCQQGQPIRKQESFHLADSRIQPYNKIAYCYFLELGDCGRTLRFFSVYQWPSRNVLAPRHDLNNDEEYLYIQYKISLRTPFGLNSASSELLSQPSP